MHKLSIHICNTFIGVGGAQGQTEFVEQQQALRLLVSVRESSAGSAKATGNDECQSCATAPDQLISGGAKQRKSKNI